MLRFRSPRRGLSTLQTVLLVVGGVAALSLCCCVGLAGFGFLRYQQAYQHAHDQSQIDRAKFGVNHLDQAIRSFQVREGRFPQSLSELTDLGPGGRLPVIENGALIDPWGRPFRYDPAGPRNRGDRPDVWSDGPTPGKSESAIGNWNQ